MTVEAVPTSDDHGPPIIIAELKQMPPTMQTLGRGAMIPILAWIVNSAPVHLRTTFFCRNGILYHSDPLFKQPSM
jgi:hypothetical protein